MRKPLVILVSLLLTAAVSNWGFPQHQVKPAQAGMQDGMDMSQMMSMMHPAIAVDNTAIYIVRGNELLKLDKKSLKIIRRTVLSTMPTSGMQEMNMPSARPIGKGSMLERWMKLRPEMQGLLRRMEQIPSAQFDQEFITNMIRHHSGAIVMSQLALERATHPELRQFARHVIDVQSKENVQFADWLKSWCNVSVPASSMTTDQAIVAQLKELHGRDFEIEYMRAMIGHHTEAIDMSEIAEQRATHPKLSSAASNIIKNQSAEIEQLCNWLANWYGVTM
jgi:uncharacterized protein (DUF305 family)